MPTKVTCILQAHLREEFALPVYMIVLTTGHILMQIHLDLVLCKIFQKRQSIEQTQMY